MSMFSRVLGGLCLFAALAFFAYSLDDHDLGYLSPQSAIHEIYFLQADMQNDMRRICGILCLIASGVFHLHYLVERGTARLIEAKAASGD